VSEQDLHDLQEQYIAARGDLLRAVQALCSGEHHPTQHRDAKPPWCDICGRDELGYPRRNRR
jgi:hypothetical protein